MPSVDTVALKDSIAFFIRGNQFFLSSRQRQLIWRGASRAIEFQAAIRDKNREEDSSHETESWARNIEAQ
jgi:hypothetical protein